MIAGKNIVIGVTGSIAAYQIADLAGHLRARMADVYIIMTESAARFITPLTFETVTMHPVIVDMFEGRSMGAIKHINLARIAHIFLIAPATANIIGKIANGIADDMLSTTVMAAKCPVVIAPAMNENMWLNPIVQKNVKKLKDIGCHFIWPEYGPMACGGEGWGRLARIENIQSMLIKISQNLPLEK